jgi:hypothetical protein
MQNKERNRAPGSRVSLIELVPSPSRVKLSEMRGLCVLALCGAAGCSHSSSAGPADAAPADDAAQTVGCQDPRADTYTANLTKTGKVYTFVLVSSDPAPPGIENNSWTVKVLDASGNAVAGTQLQVVPYMPDHRHGTTVPTITAQPDGSFSVTQVNLFMPGLWQVTVTATAGATTDSAVFAFCIQG